MDLTSPPEMPFHLQLAGLLAPAGDQACLVPGLPVLAVAEDAGGAFRECFLPGLNPPGMDFLPGGLLGHHFLALQGMGPLALKDGLYLLRPCDISWSSPEQPLPSVYEQDSHLAT